MDASLGTREDAEFIRDWYRSLPYLGRFETDAPEGWMRLGSGCYRSAFLNVEQGVVYKVQHEGQYSGQSNDQEARQIRRLLLTIKFPEGIRLPRFTLFPLPGGESVIVMERFHKLLKFFSSYDPEGNIYWSLRNVLCRIPGLYDMHGANIAVDPETKTIIPIDLGG